MLNGIPNGKGIKSYKFGIKVECYWKKGRKSGIGYFHFGVLSIEVKFSKHLPPKLNKYPIIFSKMLPYSFSFEYPVDVLNIDDYYIEKLSERENVYSLAIFKKSILCFGYFFNRKIGKLEEFSDGPVRIIAESNWKYGNGFQKIYRSGFTVSGVFIDGKMNGIVVIESEGINSIRTFIMNRPGEYERLINRLGTLKILYDEDITRKIMRFESKLGEIKYNSKSKDLNSTLFNPLQENPGTQKFEYNYYLDLLHDFQDSLNDSETVSKNLQELNLN